MSCPASILMQNESSPNQQGNNRLFDRWKLVASIRQCMALSSIELNCYLSFLLFLSVTNKKALNLLRK